MQFYNVKLRFTQNDGQVFTEVLKTNLSAPEVLVLKELHGDRNVVVEEVVDEKDDVNEAEIRQKIRDRYARARQGGRAVDAIKTVFGASFHALPKAVPGFEGKFKAKKAERKKRAEAAGLPETEVPEEIEAEDMR
jgi:hypothetical protein